jgi:hypothetical protein
MISQKLFPHNGAKRALILIENKRNFLDVGADIIEHADPVFYGEPRVAAMKSTTVIPALQLLTHSSIPSLKKYLGVWVIEFIR